MSRWWILLLCVFVVPTAALAQDDDDEDDEPSATAGLVATYASGGKSVRRIDPDVVGKWTSTPDPRLAAGQFEANWDANLLIQQSGNYRFHAIVDGRLELSIAGQQILSGTSDGDWLNSSPTKVSFGDQPISVKYQSRDSGAGTLKLFWSSGTFPIEPVPSHLFSFETEEPQLAIDSQASQWHEAYRCARCHGGDQFELPEPAPSLNRIRSGLSEDWIINKLATEPKAGDDAKMPHFGFSKTEAEEIAAFLFSVSKTAKTKTFKPGKDPKTDVVAGKRLVLSLGCLACHQLNDIGSTGAYAGGNLSDVKPKRSAGWINTWLSDPGSLNAGHRMPIFELSKDERRQIATYLGGQVTHEPNKFPASKIARGKARVKTAGCANCHSIPGMTKADDISLAAATGSKFSCLNPSANHEGPRYTQAKVELKTAITDWHKSVVSKPSAFQTGQRLLTRRNCTACHQRDGASGILPVVGQLVNNEAIPRGSSQGLIPPAITAVGDKLQDKALEQAIAGKQAKRLPWLTVRMPAFAHSKEEAIALSHYLIEHDRIPPHPDFPTAETKSNTETLVAGQALIGPGGFSCIACHSAGKYEPRNVALGTRGSNLLNPGKRLRKQFFLRWVRSPSRIVPGMEMPSITRPVKGVLDQNIHTQLAAAWDALNDSNFTVPTNPASFEQFVQVEPGSRARIIRDVFTDPVKQGQHIARPLVIGLNNGHNLMFDLDQFGLRHWWFGDTARQRTEGKSWYWDVAGIGLASQKTGADVVLQNDDGELIYPVVSRATNGRFGAWSNTPEGVFFRYALNFQLDGKDLELPVAERIEPYHFGDGLTGFRRMISVTAADLAQKVLLRVTEPPNGESITENRMISIAGQKYLVCNDGNADIGFLVALKRIPTKKVAKPSIISKPTEITSVPGFEGERLPLPGSIMPTSITWNADGNMVFSSLKGHIYSTSDQNEDGFPDTLTVFEEGLAAPFGVLRDGKDMLVAHKPEIVRLSDKDGDGHTDDHTVVSTGWGYSDNYHDWTCGLVRDSKGDIYFGLGSDYSQPKRPKDRSLWRGAVLRLTADGKTEPVSWSFRYPVGFAIDKQDRVFVTDNQGVQNTFNEVNLVQMGKHYGVPSRHEPTPDKPETTPSIRVPHPWVRSMNAIVFLPEDHASPFGGHLIGCEYDSHMLIRMTFQDVGDVVQGASYYFSKPGLEGGGSNFVGPICAAVSETGELYVGSIYDSGWLGGQNTGAIERIRFKGDLPNGIRELRATPDGFEIELVRPIPAEKLKPSDAYSVSTYTRNWKGSYATPDSGRHKVQISQVDVRDDGRVVKLTLGEKLRPEHVYEVTINAAENLFPATGHYTMKQIPTIN